MAETIRIRVEIPGGVWLREVELTEREVFARKRYSDLWHQRCFETNEGMRREIGMLMDECQPVIAVGPDDPKWQQFVDTLPGFREYWDRVYEQAMKRIHGGNYDG